MGWTFERCNSKSNLERSPGAVVMIKVCSYGCRWLLTLPFSSPLREWLDCHSSSLPNCRCYRERMVRMMVQPCKDEIFWLAIWSFLGGCSCGLGVHLFLQWGHNVQLYTEPHQPCTKQVSAWSWSFHCFHQVGNTLWDLERIWKHNRIPGARDKETDCLGKLPDVDFESCGWWTISEWEQPGRMEMAVCPGLCILLCRSSNFHHFCLGHRSGNNFVCLNLQTFNTFHLQLHSFHAQNCQSFVIINQGHESFIFYIIHIYHS